MVRVFPNGRVAAPAFPFFDAFPFPIDVTDPCNRIIYINRAFREFYGYGEGEVVGLLPHFLLPPEFDRRLLVENVQALADKQQTFAGVQTNVTASGERVDVFLAGLPLGVIAGAPPIGFVYAACRPEQKEEMMLALARLALGAYFGSGGISTFEAGAKPQRGDRQRAIMKLSALGYSTKQIAVMMDITPSTVGYVRWKLRHAAPPAEAAPAQAMLARVLGKRPRRR